MEELTLECCLTAERQERKQAFLWSPLTHAFIGGTAGYCFSFVYPELMILGIITIPVGLITFGAISLLLSSVLGIRRWTNEMRVEKKGIVNGTRYLIVRDGFENVIVFHNEHGRWKSPTLEAVYDDSFSSWLDTQDQTKPKYW